MKPPKSVDFQKIIDDIFSFAEEKKLCAVTISSGNLHRVVGGYPGSDHRMPICCSVMRKAMTQEDEILAEPPSGQGAALEIRYSIPRP